MTTGWTCLDTTLHFTVVDAAPWAPGEMSDALGHRVRRAGEMRSTWRSLLRGDDVGGARKPDRAALYDVYGPFDYAALYMSAELAPPPIGDGVGGHVHVALLLRPPEGLAAPDLDADYVARWREAGDRRFHDAPFLAFVKCKLNPSVLYDRDPDTEDPTGVLHRHAEAVGHIWQAAATWVADSSRVDGPRDAAVGLSVGWNDLVVAAHAASPDALLALVSDVRRTMMPAEAFGEPDRLAHVCATSVTTVGCLSEVRRTVEARSDGPPPETDDDGDLPADALLKRSVGAFGAVDSARPKGGGSRRAFLRPAFHAYPGHEAVLHRRLRKARESLHAVAPEGGDGPASRSTFEAGKHDVVGFPVYFDWFRDPREAVAYMSLLHRWTSTGRLDPDLGASESTPAHFDVHTYFGGVAESTESADLDRHVVGGLPPKYEIPALRLSSSFRARVLDDIVRDTRRLQLPFALSEQVRNMANRFVWAWNEVVSRDEVADLAPLVVGLRDRLADAASDLGEITDLRRDLPRDRVTEPVWAANVEDEAELRMRYAEVELERVLADCEQMVRAFRINLGNRHHAGYRSEDIADLNVPFRGALHQLLATVGMATDALLRMLVPKAPLCTSIFGPTTVTTMRCGRALLVRLSPWMLTFPLQLEVLGHEVAHAFLHEVVREGRDRAAGAGGRAPLATPWDACIDAVRRLDVDLFNGALRDSDFAEPLCDWLEAVLLGHLGDEPAADVSARTASLCSWTRSAFARHTLQDSAALTVLVPAEADGPTSGSREATVVPKGDGFLRATARAVHVWLLEELLATRDDDVHEVVAPSGAPAPSRDRVLDALFDCMRGQCLTGSSELRARLLGDRETWREYVRVEVIGRAEVPWFEDASHASVVREAIAALRRHLAEARRNAAGRWTGKVGEEVVEALAAVRREVLDTMMPAVLYASVLPEREIRRAADTRDGSAVRKAPQPLNAVPTAPPASLVNVRGGVIAGTPALEAQWCRAHAEFYRRLIPYVPAWRQQILRELRALAADGGGEDGP